MAGSATRRARPATIDPAAAAQLVAAVTHSDEADRRIAQYDLDQLSRAWHDLDDHDAHGHGGWRDDDPTYRAWHETYLTTVGAGHHTETRGAVA